VYLYRTDVKEFYHINEQQVFDKSIALYHKAMQLDPDNFSLALEYAEGYYGIRPFRTNEALVAWTNVLKIAHDDLERETVYIHLARTKMLTGRFAEARAQLNLVTNAQNAHLKHILEDAINWWQNQATNPAVSDDSLTVPGLSTNNPVAPAKMVITNAPSALTNRVPMLTNSPPFSSNTVSVLTNVPPIPPAASNLRAQPSADLFSSRGN
jgi:tetratricopeptide (TPR) repeat protein